MNGDTGLYNYDEEVANLASRIRKLNSKYNPEGFSYEDSSVVKHYFKNNPEAFVEYKQTNPQSPVADIVPELNEVVEYMGSRQKRLPDADYDPLSFGEAAGAGMTTGRYGVGEGLEQFINQLKTMQEPIDPLAPWTKQVTTPHKSVEEEREFLARQSAREMEETK